MSLSSLLLNDIGVVIPFGLFFKKDSRAWKKSLRVVPQTHANTHNSNVLSIITYHYITRLGFGTVISRQTIIR